MNGMNERMNEIKTFIQRHMSLANVQIHLI